MGRLMTVERRSYGLQMKGLALPLLGMEGVEFLEFHAVLFALHLGCTGLQARQFDKTPLKS